MNILVTSACNLRCEYCFARNEMKGAVAELSLENYKRILAFLKRSNVRLLRLMGGEPTLARDFGEMLALGVADDHFVDITVFTNGLFERDSIPLFKHPKVYLVLNCQEEGTVRPKDRARFETNVAALRSENVKFCLGVNISHTGYDTRYILGLAKEFGVSLIRWGLASPTVPVSGAQRFVHHRDFGQIAGEMFDFLVTMSDRGISSQQDCFVPLCFFRNEQWERIARDDRIFMRIGQCGPVVDISPTLEVFRCFALSGVSRTSLASFESHGAIVDHYAKQIDEPAMRIPRDETCAHCSFFRKGKCQGGCLAFKLGSEAASARRAI